MREWIAQVRPLLEARAETYDFLRRGFIAEPSPCYLEYLRGYELNCFPFANQNKNIRIGIEQISDYLTNNSSDALVLEELTSEYQRLFIGPHQLPCPPWASVYTREEKPLFQAETSEVRRAYLKYGFARVNNKTEPDDHLGLELDYMFRLCVLAFGHLEYITCPQDERSVQLCTVLSDQQRFLKEHLLRWVPAFSQDMIAAANTDFYRGLATVLNGYLEFDLEVLAELLGIELKLQLAICGCETKLCSI